MAGSPQPTRALFFFLYPSAAACKTACKDSSTKESEWRNWSQRFEQVIGMYSEKDVNFQQRVIAHSVLNQVPVTLTPSYSTFLWGQETSLTTNKLPPSFHNQDKE